MRSIGERPETSLVEIAGLHSDLSHPTTEEKVINASRRVIVEPSRYARLMLLGAMNVPIDDEPISSVLRLKPGEPVRWPLKLLLVRLARKHEELDDPLLVTGYNALAEIGPEQGNDFFVDPADVELNPYYDIVNRFEVDRLEADVDRIHNGG